MWRLRSKANQNATYALVSESVYLIYTRLVYHSQLFCSNSVDISLKWRRGYQGVLICHVIYSLNLVFIFLFHFLFSFPFSSPFLSPSFSFLPLPLSLPSFSFPPSPLFLSSYPARYGGFQPGKIRQGALCSPCPPRLLRHWFFTIYKYGRYKCQLGPRLGTVF